MNNDNLIDAIGHVDDAMLESVNKLRTRKNKNQIIRILGGLVAAGLIFGISLSVGIHNRISKASDTTIVNIGGIERRYKADISVLFGELGITYRWEDRTVAEQYSRLDINDGDFTTACSEIDASKLDKSIGVYTASGYDDYTGTEYTRPVNVYSVRGISEDRIVAAELDSKYYIYRRISREFYDSYNSTLDLKLRGFILKLFSAAEPHSHTITLSVRKLKELIHMGHGTISNYIEQLRDMDLLDEVGDSIILKAKGLLIDLPKDKYVEEVKADFEHMIAFNESRGNPISRECMIYKKYKENNFEEVKDMHALMKSLSSGLVGRKQEVKDKEELTDLFL